MKSRFQTFYNIVFEQINADSNKQFDEIDKTIEEIKEKLNSAEFFGNNERLKNRIIKYLNILKNNEEHNYENYDKLLKIFHAPHSESGIGLNENQSKELANELEDKFDPTTVKSILNYLMDRSQKIDDYCDGNKHSFVELFSNAGLNLEQPELISYLRDKQFLSMPNIGKTELLFSIIFDTAHRPSGKNSESGDVIVNNSNLEVKGDKARLGGQSGYGRGFLAAKYFKTEFVKLNENDAAMKKNIESLGNETFNFNDERLTSVTNSFLVLCNVTARSNPDFSIMDAKNIMKEAFRKVFVNESAFDQAFDVSNFIDDYLMYSESSADTGTSDFENVSSMKALADKKHSLTEQLASLREKYKGQRRVPEIMELNKQLAEVNSNIDELKNGMKNSTKFRIDNANRRFESALLLFALKYYQTVDGFSYFALSNKNDFIIFNTTLLDDPVQIKDKIALVTGVSFADKAGEQGGKVSIQLK